MRTHQRSVQWLTPAAIVSFLIFGYFGLAMWGKRDWCGGWARHYAATAARMRTESRDVQKTIEEREELLVAAEWHDMIAAKYARAASRPWLPYPKAPLITQADKVEALRRTAANRAALSQ